jgi:hypothetical protein
LKTWKAAYGLTDNVNKGYVPTRSYSARVNNLLFRIYQDIKNSRKDIGVRALQVSLNKRILRLNSLKERLNINQLKQFKSKSLMLKTITR